MKRRELGQTDGSAFADPFAVAARFGFFLSGNGKAQSRIADDESGVRIREHCFDGGFGFAKFRSDVPTIGTQNSGECLCAARAAVKRNLFCKSNRSSRNDEEATD